MKLKHFVFSCFLFLFLCCFFHLLVINSENTEKLIREMNHKPNVQFGETEVTIFYFQKLYPRMLKYEPRENDYPGIDGHAVEDNPSEKEESQKRFDLYKFNELASSKIPLLRKIPEKRPSKCFKQKYPVFLPVASIIIVFHNEAWSALLRTIITATARAPEHLIKQVILVDDHSDLDEYPHLGIKLDSFADNFPKLVILRAPERIGLIKARLMGAKVATGDVLVFLDSHCESFDGWLEPLLAGIKKYPRSAITPVIDVITFKSFRISLGTIDSPSVGVFDWNMNFRWGSLIGKIPDDMLIPSPTMAGGLFAIRKDFFYESGSYDEQMEFWGSENLEMSFRLGMCFEGIYIHSCSIVAHVFRDTSPHKMPSEAILRNKVRMIEVWLDGYKDYVYRKSPSLRNHLQSINISDRAELRKTWNCSSFEEFAKKNIEYVKFLPNSKVPASGQIKMKNHNYCIDSLSRSASTHGLYTCHGNGGNQAFILTSNGELRNTNEECFDLAKHMIKAEPNGLQCHGMKGNQFWSHSKEDGRIIHVVSKLCLEGNTDTMKLEMNTCDETKTNEKQLWEFSEYNNIT